MVSVGACKQRCKGGDLVRGSAVERSCGGAQTGRSAALCEVLRGLVGQEPVEIIVRVFKSVLINAVVSDVVSASMK